MQIQKSHNTGLKCQRQQAVAALPSQLMALGLWIWLLVSVDLAESVNTRNSYSRKN